MLLWWRHTIQTLSWASPSMSTDKNKKKPIFLRSGQRWEMQAMFSWRDSPCLVLFWWCQTAILLECQVHFDLFFCFCCWKCRSFGVVVTVWTRTNRELLTVAFCSVFWCQNAANWHDAKRMDTFPRTMAETKEQFVGACNFSLLVCHAQSAILFELVLAF